MVLFCLGGVRFLGLPLLFQEKSIALTRDVKRPLYHCIIDTKQMIMENTYQLLPTCSCGHQLILAPGSYCEVCMGMVSDQVQSISEEWYGADYFDALEVAMANGGIAA